MTVYDLTREQIKELKGDYLCQLAESGEFAEILDVDYNEPSYSDLANADEIVPDDVIFRNYDGVQFTDDDFCCSMNEPSEDWKEEAFALLDVIFPNVDADAKGDFVLMYWQNGRTDAENCREFAERYLS